VQLADADAVTDEAELRPLGDERQRTTTFQR